MTVSLAVEKRDGTAGEGAVPGVVYGPKQESISLSINKQTFEKTLQEAGDSTILTLTGLDEEIEVLVHDVAFDPARGGVQHVDFYAIERGKELTTNVTLEYVGEAPVEKTGATINKVMTDIEVTCRPSVLPSQIEVDITTLTEEDSQIRVADLAIPEGVSVTPEPDDIVANVSAAREEEPEEVAGDVDMDAIEVEGEKKEEAGEATEEAPKEE